MPLKLRTSLIVTAVAAAVLAIGNPDLDGFATYARDRLETTPGVTGVVAGLLPGATRSVVLLNTRRRNFGLFSTYQLDLDASRPVSVLGILWHFYPLGPGFAAPSPPGDAQGR